MDCFERKLCDGIYQSDRHLPWCPFRRVDPLDLHVKQFVNDVRIFFSLSKKRNIIKIEKRKKAFLMNCCLPGMPSVPRTESARILSFLFGINEKKKKKSVSTW